VLRLNGGCSGVLRVVVSAVLEPSLFASYSFVDRFVRPEHRRSWWQSVLSICEEDGVSKRTGLLTRGLMGCIKAEVAVISTTKQASAEVCTDDLIFKIN